MRAREGEGECRRYGLSRFETLAKGGGQIGQTFYQTLSEIQKNVAPHIFMTGEYDSKGYPKFKPLGFLDTAEASSVIRNVADYANCIGIPLPEQDDELAKKYCQMDIDSNKGWV